MPPTRRSKIQTFPVFGTGYCLVSLTSFLHSKGGVVKIALGGALFSMGQYVTSPEDALRFAEQMQADDDVMR